MKILFILLLFSFNASSFERKIRSFPFYQNGAQGKLSFVLDQATFQANLHWKGEVLKSYLKSAATESFIEFGSYYREKNLYVFFTFQKGVHGETIEVWKFPEAKRVWSYNSTWPVKPVRKKDQLEIHYSDEREGDNFPRKVRIFR